MNTMYRKKFTGTLDEWVKRCKELHPKGVQEFFGNAIYWVADGVDVGAFNGSWAQGGTWVKEKFQ